MSNVKDCPWCGVPATLAHNIQAADGDGLSALDYARQLSGSSELQSDPDEWYTLKGAILHTLDHIKQAAEELEIPVTYDEQSCPAWSLEP